MVTRGLRFTISLVLCLVLLAVPVLAQEGADEATTTQTTDSEGPGEDRASRLEEYKTRATERVTEARQTRLANRCSAAQTRITELLSADRSKVDRRIAIYQNIVDSVTQIITRLQSAGVDTAGLETAFATVQNQADTLAAAMRSYVSVLTDLAEMDCESDTEAFQAALSIVRESRVDLRTQAEALRGLMDDELRAALQAAKQEVADSAAETTEQ